MSQCIRRAPEPSSGFGRRNVLAGRRFGGGPMAAPSLVLARVSESFDASCQMVTPWECPIGGQMSTVVTEPLGPKTPTAA